MTQPASETLTGRGLALLHGAAPSEDFLADLPAARGVLARWPGGPRLWDS